MAGLVFGLLVRSGLLSDSEGMAVTLGLTAPAFVVGIFQPPTAAHRAALRDWVLRVALIPVIGVALFSLGYAITLRFSALFTIAVLVRHLLFSVAYTTAFVAYCVRNPQPYRRGNLFIAYMIASLVIGVCAWLGREAHYLVFGNRGLMESLVPISEGAATLLLAAVNLTRSRRASFQ